jgi:hypothetical protein
MRQYSIDKQEIGWNGLDIKAGLAVGTSFVEAIESPAFNQKRTAMGGVVRAHVPGSSGTASITVDRETQLYQDLQTIHNADRDPDGRDQVADMTRKDTESGAEVRYTNAYIMTMPDDSIGTELSTVTVVFGFEERKLLPATPAQNVVGL